jgi:hypothetical protein
MSVVDEYSQLQEEFIQTLAQITTTIDRDEKWELLLRLKVIIRKAEEALLRHEEELEREKNSSR